MANKLYAVLVAKSSIGSNMILMPIFGLAGIFENREDALKVQRQYFPSVNGTLDYPMMIVKIVEVELNQVHHPFITKDLDLAGRY